MRIETPVKSREREIGLFRSDTKVQVSLPWRSFVRKGSLSHFQPRSKSRAVRLRKNRWLVRRTSTKYAIRESSDYAWARSKWIEAGRSARNGTHCLSPQEKKKERKEILISISRRVKRYINTVYLNFCLNFRSFLLYILLLLSIYLIFVSFHTLFLIRLHSAFSTRYTLIISLSILNIAYSLAFRTGSAQPVVKPEGNK